jgi:hypothetical protein
LKINDIHPLLVYTNDVNVVDGSVHTTKKNTDALVAASRENGPVVNANKIWHMVMSRGQNAGQFYNVKIDNSSLEKVKEFKYLLTNFTIQNFIQQETRR